MKEEFEPKSFKNYNLTPVEQLKLDKFLKENLEKCYIWPSQSPMASPFLFCIQERQETLTLSKLPVFERLDNQKLLSITTDFRHP